MSMPTLEQYSVTQFLTATRSARLHRAIAHDGKSVMLKTAAVGVHGYDNLRREYELLTELSCAGVPRPYALPEDEHSLALVHEDIGGELLETLIDGRPCALAEFFPLALSLVATLDYLHGVQVVHRNIQPRSVLRNSSTRKVQLIDFSLASRLVREQVPLASADKLEGSLPYLAPEQTGRMNRAVDYRADFYALGVTLYELLTGQKPFVAGDALEMVHCHLARPPRPPHSIVP